MSGKLCAECLEKYVPLIFLCRLTEGYIESIVFCIIDVNAYVGCIFLLL
jgi:hypothetical protein